MAQYITPEQKTFFETFGFLHFPGLFKADIDWICEEYEKVWSSRPDVNAIKQSHSFPGMIVLQSRRLQTLLDDPRITEICETLFGEGFSFNGGDGSVYYGDTQWHSDIAGGLWSEESLVRNAKVAFYLDHLTRETGALRVIPGSHLFGDTFCETLTEQIPSGELGVGGRDIPAYAVETQPGDLVVFDHRLKHASFGGGNRRRMMNLNLMETIRTETQREAMLNLFRNYRDANGVKWEFPKEFMESATPGQLRRVARTLELGKIVNEEKTAAAAL
jgi:hypothetical protein